MSNPLLLQRLQRFRKGFFKSAIIVISLTATFAIAADNEFNLGEVDAQIKLIDIEVLILRAEMARKNGQSQVVQGLLNQLAKLNPPNSFLSRIEALKFYLTIAPAVILKETAFYFDTQNIAVLLPLTGTYAKAGNEILRGIESKMPEEFSLEIIDTAMYANAFELWELVNLYQPSFIFGPLKKNLVAGMVGLNTGVPSLMFNQIPKKLLTNKSYIKYLSPSRLDDVSSLMKQILAQNYQSILMVIGLDSRSQQLAKHFERAWSKLPVEEQFEIIKRPADKSMDKLLYQVLGAEFSTGRASWLQRTIDTPLDSRIRSRQDIQAVISFVPYRMAIQISPLLAYYDLRSVSHIWFPASLPSAKVFSKTLPFWYETQAILPFHQAQNLQSYLKDSSIKPDVGIFYALGETAVQMVKKITTLNINQAITSVGKIAMTPEGSLIIKPGFYWLDANEMIKTH